MKFKKMPLDIDCKYEKDAEDYVAFYMDTYFGMRAPNGTYQPTAKQANEFLTCVFNMFGLFDSPTEDLTPESEALIKILESKLTNKMYALEMARANAMAGAHKKMGF